MDGSPGLYCNDPNVLLRLHARLRSVAEQSDPERIYAQDRVLP